MCLRDDIGLGSGRGAVGFLLEALVVIMNGEGESALGVLLANAVQVELALNVGGFGDLELESALARLVAQLLIEDVLANDDTAIANIDAGALNELFDFSV